MVLVIVIILLDNAFQITMHKLDECFILGKGTLPVTCYRIAGKFGEESNLVDWRFEIRLPN